MVEELLQLLVDKVDGELLEPVEGEDLKASDVEDGAEVDFLHAGIDQSLIAFLNQPKEGSVIDRSSDPTHSVCCLVHILTFGHPLSANLPFKIISNLSQQDKNLDLWLHKGCHQVIDINFSQLCHLKEHPLCLPFSICIVFQTNLSEIVLGVRLALLLPSLLLELHLSHCHDRCCDLGINFILSCLILRKILVQKKVNPNLSCSHFVAVPLLSFRESNDIKSSVRELELFVVVYGVNLVA